MALTDIEKVRYGVGDITLPYVFSDVVIQSYLATNDDDVEDTIDELQPYFLSAIAARSGSIRTEDLWEDTSKQSSNYIKAIEKANQLKAGSAYPIIGGSSATSDDLSVGVDQFDAENITDTDTFYNSI